MELNIRIRGGVKITLTLVATVGLIASAVFMGYKLFNHLSAHYKKAAGPNHSGPFRCKTKFFDTTQKGYFLLAPREPYMGSSGMLAIFDNHCRLVKSIITPLGVADFRQWIINGKTRYSYTTYGKIDTSSKGRISSYCTLVLLDSSLTEINTFGLLPVKTKTVTPDIGLDGHDVIFFDDDHYIVYSDYPRMATNIPVYLSPAVGIRTAVPVIEEVKAGKVVWQWDAGDFPEFYANSFADNRYSDSSTIQDPIHMNSMVLDPYDSNLILSMRNLNQIVKISRKTGEILWRLGGRNSDFPLLPDQCFFGQHNVSVYGPGPTLLLLDNGVTPNRPQSRVMEITLDVKEKRVVRCTTTKLAGKKVETQGSVEIVGDNYFVCGGFGGYVTLLDRKTARQKMLMYYNQPSYRAYWVPQVNGLK